MRSLALAFALLLLLPVAEAGSTGASVTKEEDALTDSGDSVSVREQVDFRIADAAQYGADATWTAWIQKGADQKPVVSLRRNATVWSVGPERINETGASTATFHAYSISLRGLAPDVRAGDVFQLIRSYTVPGSEYRHRVADAAPVSVVAVAKEGREAQSSQFELASTAADTYHGGLGAAHKDQEFTVAFVDAAGAARASNLNPILWFIAGLLLGVMGILYSNRKGWTGAGRAKKYEKGGELESRDLLEARRRTLMAALKELEVAHEAKEIPDSAYAPLKEEYKAQAVRVLRTIEDKRDGVVEKR